MAGWNTCLIVLCLGVLFFSKVDGQNLSLCQDQIQLEDTLQHALKSKKLDLVFILDRSGSINENELESMKNLTKKFLGYAHGLGVYIHPEYARLTVTSFGSNLITAYTFMSDYTVCGVNEYIDKVQHVPDNEKSYLHLAFQKAENLLERDSFKERPKVMVVMFDGNYEGNEDLQLKTKRDANHLKEKSGVEIFTVGVGHYLDTKERRDYVRELATSEGHFACIQNWTKFFEDADLDENYNTNDQQLLQDVKPDGQQNCPVCGRSSQCFCNVMRREFICRSENCSSEECRTVNGRPFTHVPHIAGGSVGALVLFVLVGLALFFFLRKAGTDPPDETEYVENRTIPASLPRYPAPGPPVTVNFPADPPPLHPPPGPDDYLEILLNPQEYNMPGWLRFLNAYVDGSEVDAVAIIHLKPDYSQWAMTNGFTLKASDLEALGASAYLYQQHMVWRTTVLDENIEIRGTFYKIDHDCHHSSSLWFYENGVRGSRQKAVCFRVKSGYLLAGLTKVQYKDKCLKTIKDLALKLVLSQQ